MSDYFLYLRIEIAENSVQKRQFRVRSRITLAEYNDMTGLGLLPAGLFLFSEEMILKNIPFWKMKMHPLWTITIKRP